MSSILTAKDLCKTFSNESLQQHVLKNLNLTIEKGDFTVIMGNSGSGKSTLPDPHPHRRVRKRGLLRPFPRHSRGGERQPPGSGPALPGRVHVNGQLRQPLLDQARLQPGHPVHCLL